MRFGNCGWVSGLLLAAALPAGAQDWSPERLFSRPSLWGTRPEKITWPKRGHTLLFLWNAAGDRFLDLYGYDAEQGKLLRLTDLEGADDPLNRSAAEKDDRRRRYLEPQAGIADFDASADGQQAAFSYRGDLYVVATDGSRPPLRLTHTKAAEIEPAFSPDGARVAFVRDGQLYVQDLRTAQLTQVTDIEGEGQSLAEFRWSPDGKRFLYTVRLGAGRRLLLPNFAGRIVTAAPFPRSLAGDGPAETRTFVIPAEGGPSVVMQAGPWAKVYGTETPEWSPDARFILQNNVDAGLKKTQLLVLDAASGKATVAVEDSDPAWVEPAWGTWSPDGREILFASERDGWFHLYVVAREGGEPRRITRGAQEVHTERLFGRDPQWAGGYIWYSSTAAGPSERQFYRVRPDGTAMEKLSSREGLTIGAVSEDGRHVATLEADLRHPFDLWVNGRRVATSPRPDFERYRWPETRFVSFPSRGDGKAVAAKLLLPPGYTPERRKKQWPAVFFIHGSGYATSVLKQWGSYQEARYAFNCYLANKGYVVIDPDYRGSSGYGRDWRTGVYLNLGGPDLDDVLGGVDYLGKLGNIDMGRVGLWGSSYGGFLTAMAMFRSPGTFRAGAAFSGVYDWENYNAFYTGQRLGRPEDHPEAYRRSSPIWFSDLLRNPLLIVHGMVDNNVLFQDAVQLTEKLVHEGKPFEEIYYPEESHVFARGESLSDAFRRAAGFFDRNLR